MTRFLNLATSHSLRARFVAHHTRFRLDRPGSAPPPPIPCAPHTTELPFEVGDEVVRLAEVHVGGLPCRVRARSRMPSKSAEVSGDVGLSAAWSSQASNSGVTAKERRPSSLKERNTSLTKVLASGQTPARICLRRRLRHLCSRRWSWVQLCRRSKCVQTKAIRSRSQTSEPDTVSCHFLITPHFSR